MENDVKTNCYRSSGAVPGITAIMDEKMMCAVLGISPKTAQAWRHNGCGPVFYRCGSRLIRYKFEDVKAFLESGRIEALTGR